MGQLSGPNGVIRQTEFFLYSQRDREALEACRSQNLRYPEITGWIRADQSISFRSKGVRLEKCCAGTAWNRRPFSSDEPHQSSSCTFVMPRSSPTSPRAAFRARCTPRCGRDLS